ncbi:Outer membrane protein assembly factor BamB [Alphaproteobacteria bacterium SO-S41]|nr:Outer membrane protein assembly factor BamB [Alphaproteobacteria bacterium SO-S41]
MKLAVSSLRMTLARSTVLAIAFGLAGCSTLDSIGDLFGSSEKAKVPGQRISLMPRGGDSLAQDQAFVGKAVGIPAAVHIATWTQPGGTPENVVGNTDVPVTFGVAWTANVGVSTSSESAITAAPIVANGMVFTLDAAANVRAFDEASGGEVWGSSVAVADESSDYYFFSTGGDTAEEGYGGGLAYENGRLFVTTGFGEVTALDVRTGGKIWTKKVESPFHTAPTVRDGRVYVMNRDNRAWALDAATGAEVWTQEVFSETASILGSSSPAVSADLAIIGYTNGDLYALRTNNGRALWNDSLTRTGQADTLSSINDIAGRPALDGYVVYAISHAGRLVAVDTRSGERLWTRDVAGVQTPWVAGDYVYVAAMNGSLICFEKSSGRVAWTTYLGRWQDEQDREDPVEWSGPLMAQGHLVLVSTDGRMVVVAASTGAVEQTYQLGTGSIIAPIAANGTIYILNDDGVLTAYR